jgi:hypothetical protein
MIIRGQLLIVASFSAFPNLLLFFESCVYLLPFKPPFVFPFLAVLAVQGLPSTFSPLSQPPQKHSLSEHSLVHSLAKPSRPSNRRAVLRIVKIKYVVTNLVCYLSSAT